MKLIKQEQDKMIFETDLDISLANALRRYLNEVPTLAVEEIEISKNSSSIYDEIVSHRLGLIPLKTEKSMNDKTAIKLKMSSKALGFVFSQDIKGEAKVIYDKIPVTYLDEDQEISLTAIAKLGKGKEHSKHTPGLMYYRNVSEMNTDKSLKGEILSIVPEAEVKEKGNGIMIIDNGAKEICDLVTGIAESKGMKIETEVKDNLVVNLESFGQLEIKDILKKAIGVLQKDLSEVGKKLK
ncbi:DNA-directed RNA polymerase subunit D [archaeon]|jgi:DNA-directed RNA polymerase subunit D|nr:DNA-directed RNA polymerase subunit D [archaeon]MBT4373074.1 DNA-directed RNA polymerase subunit D [archaeon]MBT4531419.1 DNA-directed RNA polymerase subunit D [archaeon]MBT7001403.1 DNA-directed RNA polymerase subunit D [archaeon]MBT7282111.1 DNA-directed RNA polymerase subunit D [archaeon]